MNRGSQIQGYQTSNIQSNYMYDDLSNGNVFNDEIIDNMGSFDRRKYKNFMMTTRNPVNGLAPVRTAGDIYYRMIYEQLPGLSEHVQGIHRPSRLNAIPTFYSAYSAPINYGVRTPNGGVFRKKAVDMQINDWEFI